MSKLLGANQVFKELKSELDLINLSNERAYHLGNDEGMHSRFITGSSYIHIPELEETLKEASNLSMSTRISAKSSKCEYETVSGFRDWLGVVKYLDTIGLKQDAIDLEKEIREKYNVYTKAIASERGKTLLKPNEAKIKDKYMPLFQKYFTKQGDLGVLIKPFEVDLKPGDLKIDTSYSLLSEISKDLLAKIETHLKANFEPNSTVKIPENHPLIEGINDHMSSMEYEFGEKPFGDLIIRAEDIKKRKVDDTVKLTAHIKRVADGDEKILEVSANDLRNALIEEDQHTRFTIYVKYRAKINEEVLNKVKGLLFL